MRRGDIYYADLRPVIGSEQGGIRPVLIVQNDVGNRYSPTVIAAAITSQVNKAIYGYFTFAKWAHFCCRCRWRLLCSFAERHHFIYSLNNDEDDKGHDNKMNHGGKERTVVYVVVADQVELSLNLAAADAVDNRFDNVIGKGSND